MTYAVVTLSRYPELATRLIASIRETHAQMPPVIAVCDRHNHDFGADVDHVRSWEPFVFARNANKGICAALRSDVILINDDCAITEPETFNTLAEAAYRSPDYGIVAPLIDGGVGNPYQSAHRPELWRQAGMNLDMLKIGGTGPDSMPVCFVAVYLKRAMIDRIGMLDEKFREYGFDDNDYCIRARLAKWETVITRACTVKHGDGGADLRRGQNWSASFARGDNRNNQEYFLQKWAPKVQYVPFEDCT